MDERPRRGSSVRVERVVRDLGRGDGFGETGRLITRGPRFRSPPGALGVASFRPGFTTRGFPRRARSRSPLVTTQSGFSNPLFVLACRAGTFPPCAASRRHSNARAARTRTFPLRLFATAHDRPSTLREVRARRAVPPPGARGAPPDPPRRSPCLSSVLRGCFPRDPRAVAGRPARPRRDRLARPRRIARRAFFRRAGAPRPARRVRAARPPNPPARDRRPPHPPSFPGSNTNRGPEPPSTPLPAQLGSLASHDG